MIRRLPAPVMRPTVMMLTGVMLLTAGTCLGQSHLVKTDRFGGHLGKTLEATGFFHVTHINGRAYFVTPEGHPYVAIGANHVGKYLDQQAESMGLFARVGGRRAEAATYLVDAMGELGLNAGEAYAPIAPEFKPVFPWVHNVRFPFKSKFAFDVFEPGFGDTLAKSIIKQCETIVDDPMVLGVAFNDLPVWDARRIAYYEKLPPKSPGAVELARYRREGKSDEAFLGHVADTLYRQMLAATRAAAPNHLFFGERFYLRSAPDEVLASVGKYVDVFCTQALILSPQRPPEWQVFQQAGYDHEHALVGKPIVVIDWAAPFSLGQSFETERGEIRQEQVAAVEAASWLTSAFATPYIIGVFKCQLIGTHANDRWFDGRARRTYFTDDGRPFDQRTAITREAHRQALKHAYAQFE